MYPQDVQHNEMHSPYKPGDIVQASYAFKRDKYEDLPFVPNDKLEIICIASDPNWAHARNAIGETGLIPLNYVKSATVLSKHLTLHSWYHGPISRMESEKIMHGHSVGSFLVRESDLFPGDLTLCLVGPSAPHCSNNLSAKVDVSTGKATMQNASTATNVQHYRILCRQALGGRPRSMTYNSSATKYSLDEYDWFSNLTDLIKYYSVPDSGLVARLLYPVVDLQRKRLSQLKSSGLIIPRSDLTLGDNIGRGEFGEVHRATYKNRQVAVKIYKKTACKLTITYEASLMSQISHQNVVAFVGLVYEPDDAVYLLTEYISNGNLLTYLHSRTRNEIGQLAKLQFSIDVCTGLVHLERSRIVHRDIAARNVLLSDQSDRLTAKLADFGMARHLDEPSPTGSTPGHLADFLVTNSSLPTYCATPSSVPPDYVVLQDNAAIPVKWTAPEAVRDRIFSSKSDVWSFGILIWEIYSYGRIPYPRLMANQVIRQLATGYRMKPPEECPTEIYDLMRRTWHSNPDERPNFSSILGQLTGIHKALNTKDHILRPLFTDAWGHNSRASTLPRRIDWHRSPEKNEFPEQICTDNAIDPESDCYDRMEEQKGRSCVVEPTMTRSFNNKSNTSPDSRPSCAGTVESNRRMIFCLPKLDRFQ